MYIERNEFQLKFGGAKEALPMWKEYLSRVQGRDKNIHCRLLTDVSGPGYLIILEIEYETPTCRGGGGAVYVQANAPGRLERVLLEVYSAL
jgi:hypothetical protein